MYRSTSVQLTMRADIFIRPFLSKHQKSRMLESKSVARILLMSLPKPPVDIRWPPYAPCPWHDYMQKSTYKAAKRRLEEITLLSIQPREIYLRNDSPDLKSLSSIKPPDETSTRLVSR